MKQSQSLLESFKANLKESYLIRYFWGNETGFIKRDRDGYDRTPNKNEALKFKSEKEAKHAKEDINKFFNGRAKLDVIEESQELSEDNEEEFYGGGANEKVGGDYDDFIYELSNFRTTMNNWYDQCSTGLARQIVEETIMSFDNLLTKYEQQKDIEIHGAMNESQELNEDEGFKHFDNEESVKTEFTNPIIFTPDKIEQNGTGELSKCKFNSVNANETNPEENPDIYVGYVVLEDKNGKLIGFKHYWNGKGDIAIDHTDVKSNSLYNQGKLVYYIGEKVN